MVVPLLLLAVSLAGIGASLLSPGLEDLFLIAAASALASLALLLSALRRGGFRRGRRKWIFVDGSNVMHWKGEGADIGTVREVIERLSALGYKPGVVFDANAGYKLRGRYLHDGDLGRLLGLPASRVLVVAKGTPADPTLLAAARDAGARIVTNDRFRDWAEAYPEVHRDGHLVRGGYRAGELRLDLDPELEPARASGRPERRGTP